MSNWYGPACVKIVSTKCWDGVERPESILKLCASCVCGPWYFHILSYALAFIEFILSNLYTFYREIINNEFWRNTFEFYHGIVASYLVFMEKSISGIFWSQMSFAFGWFNLTEIFTACWVFNFPSFSLVTFAACSYT